MLTRDRKLCGETERSLLAYEEPGPKSTELIPSSISISSIFIHGFLLCFSFPPLLFLSLYVCVMYNLWSFYPSPLFSVSTETFLSASNRLLLLTVYFCRKTFWQKTKASCHLRVYIKVLSSKLDLYYTLHTSRQKTLNETRPDFFY